MMIHVLADYKLNIEDTSLIFEVGNEVAISTADVTFKGVEITDITLTTVEVEDSKGNIFEIEIDEIYEISEW